MVTARGGVQQHPVHGASGLLTACQALISAAERLAAGG
jgi:hypothetical protein